MPADRLPVACASCEKLLHEALNLTVRGRQLDGINRREAMLSFSLDREEWQKDGLFDRFVELHNADCEPWGKIETRSLTPQLWLEDQFSADLHDWEVRARKHMMEAHP